MTFIKCNTEINHKKGGHDIVTAFLIPAENIVETQRPVESLRLKESKAGKIMSEISSYVVKILYLLQLEIWHQQS